MAKNGKPLGFLPSWRKGTYIILIFNLFMLAWIISSTSSGSLGSGDASNCGSLSQSDCNTAEGIGTAIAMMLLIPLFAMGEIVLGVIWLATNGKKGRTAQSETTPSKGVSWPASPVATTSAPRRCHPLPHLPSSVGSGYLVHALRVGPLRWHYRASVTDNPQPPKNH